MKYLAILSIMIGLSFVSLGESALFADEENQNVEIFVGGKKYNSFGGYRDEKIKQALEREQRLHARDNNADPQDLQDMFNEAVQGSPNHPDLKFDPAKLKTVYIKKPDSGSVPASSRPYKSFLNLDPLTHTYTVLNQLGFDQGIHKVISEFSLTKPQISNVVNAEDLEKVLENSFGTIHEPLLLISDKKALRVMRLESDDPNQTQKR
jgi:hypothetical protein